MGRIIRSIAESRGHSVSVIIDPAAVEADFPTLTPESLVDTDGIIEFSLPGPNGEWVAKNVQVYAETGARVVLGTTGWDEHRDLILAPLAHTTGAFLYGSNFSLGANMLFRLTAQAAKMIETIDSYDIMVHEYHHSQKKDSPSGTAFTLGTEILKNNRRKKVIVGDSLRNRPIRPEELHVSSTRGGHIPGIHTVTLDSEADSLNISHTARSREGFALGAVLGLEWVAQKNGVFTTDDFFSTLFAH